MNTLCRECGKPSTPEYTDEHDGLCMACVHKQWPRNYLDAGDITDPVYIEGEPLTDTMKSLGITGLVVTPDFAAKCMPYIDHDMVQPQTSNPIRDAIDQACVDLFGRKP